MSKACLWFSLLFGSFLFFERERETETPSLARSEFLTKGRERETSAAFASVKDTFLSFITLLFIYSIRERDRERERDPEKRVFLIH